MPFNFKMRFNPRSVYKLSVCLLVTSLAITSVVVIMCFSFSYHKKQPMDVLYDFEGSDEDVVTYYEYMGDNTSQDLKRNSDARILRKIIRDINKKQSTKNPDQYKNLLPSSSVVVIQVHHEVDVELFKILLFSLKSSTAILTSLLIFSHDYYDDKINTLIEEVGFVSYTRIYYPYSTQLFPDTFPGDDEKLCTDDFHCERSALRYELFAQKKHFWWWQMNYVFDKLYVTRNYNNAILFLEADQFVLRDFAFIAKIMESFMKMKCSKCEVVSLGAHAPDLSQYQKDYVSVTISPWELDIASAGIAFNRVVWNSIKKHSSLFCNHNDYRWDASLRHVSLNRDKGQLVFLSVDAPRIIKLFRKHDGYLDNFLDRLIENVTYISKKVESILFPRNINVSKAIIRKNIEKEKQLGGWEDVRDRGLCMYLVNT